MINDYFDLENGVDTDDYVRALYAPHPILSGWVTMAGLRNAILLANVVDLAILVALVATRGPLVAVFALSGLFISFFYVAPPITLKKRGLGEPGVFLVWGPLMIGGTFLIATGTILPWVWIASLPYAILVTTVLFGKHIDKIGPDGERGVRTLPVILGEAPAKVIASALMIGFYPDRGRGGGGRLRGAMGGDRGPGPPPPDRNAQGLPARTSGNAPTQLPDLAAVVRVGRVRPHSAACSSWA